MAREPEREEEEGPDPIMEKLDRIEGRLFLLDKALDEIAAKLRELSTRTPEDMESEG